MFLNVKKVGSLPWCLPLIWYWDIQLPVNSFMSYYVSDFQRCCTPRAWLPREGSVLKIVSAYSPTSSPMIYYTERHQIHQYQAACTHEDHQSHFKNVAMLKCSRAQLLEQVNSFLLHSWAQRAGLMPKAKGHSRARSAARAGRTGVQRRGGSGCVLCPGEQHSLCNVISR